MNFVDCHRLSVESSLLGGVLVLIRPNCYLSCMLCQGRMRLYLDFWKRIWQGFSVVKTPPFEVTETGYAGFTIPMTLFFNGFAKEFNVDYDMNLTMGNLA